MSWLVLLSAAAVMLMLQFLLTSTASTELTSAHCAQTASPADTLSCLQLVDDMLDYTGSSTALGKPALNDLQSGLATAPVLYAAERHPELRPLILRKFKVSCLLKHMWYQLAAACNALHLPGSAAVPAELQDLCKLRGAWLAGSWGRLTSTAAGLWLRRH